MKPATLRQIRDIIILSAAGILLLFAQSAYWLNHTIFNKEAFTSIVTPVVQSDSTHQAIAGTIVDQAFAKRPLVNRLIGSNVKALVAGLLGTDLATQATSTLIDKSYTYLTSNNPQPLAIDLVAIKTPLEKITQILGNNGTDVAIDPSAIPDSITLFDPSNLPDVYGYSILMLWLGPLFWLGTLFLVVLYLYLDRRQYARRVYTLGGVILFVSFLGLLVGPLLPPPIVAQVPIPALRDTVNQLINGLLAPFTNQMIIMIVITALVLIIFALRFAILHGAQWLVKKTADMVTTANKPASKSQK